MCECNEKTPFFLKQFERVKRLHEKEFKIPSMVYDFNFDIRNKNQQTNFSLP